MFTAHTVDTVERVIGLLCLRKILFIRIHPVTSHMFNHILITIDLSVVKFKRFKTANLSAVAVCAVCKTDSRKGNVRGREREFVLRPAPFSGLG